MSSAPHPLEPDEHRRARRLFMLKSLSERGFALAMKVADQADAQLETDADPDPAAPPKPTQAHQTFARYARIVSLLVSAEHRIANHTGATRRPYRIAGVNADPRRPRLQQFLHHATRNSPERAQLRRAAVETLDEALDRDGAGTLAPADILWEICERYGLPFDPAKLPDDFLVAPRDATCVAPRDATCVAPSDATCVAPGNDQPDPIPPNPH